MPTADTQQGLEDEDIIMSQVRNSAMCIHMATNDSPENSLMINLALFNHHIAHKSV